MVENHSNPHKSSGSTSESPENQERGTLFQTVPFSPITHNVDGYVIVNDDSYIYETLGEQYRRLAAATGKPGSAKSPLHVGDFSPAWVHGDREYEAGYYSSRTGIGRLNDEDEVVPCDDYWLRLFDDTAEAKSAKIPAKCTLTIEPRASDLVNLKGEPFGYPKAVDGKRYEGTYIKVKSSYAQSGEELLSWVHDWFKHLDAEWGTDLAHHFKPIRETYYIGGLERHVRFNIDAIERGVFAADNTKRLCHTGDEREARHAEDVIENGRVKIFQFSTTELSELGFEEGPRDDDGRLTVKSDKVKIYRTENARQYGRENFRHHPKFETRINEGKFHVSEWDNLVARADSILLTHLRHASITEEDLVSDDLFRPVDKDGEPIENHPTRQSTEYACPTGRMAELREYWRSAETRRNLEGLIFHSKTESYRDILTALIFKFSGMVTYEQLMSATGLSYSGVRKAVGKLVEARVLTRIRECVTYVEWANQLAYEKGRAWLREYLDPAEVLASMNARAEERELRREGHSTSRAGAEGQVCEKVEAEEVESPTAVEADEEHKQPVGYNGLSQSERAEVAQKMESGEFSTFISGTEVTGSEAD
jgi:hypothetical protein